MRLLKLFIAMLLTTVGCFTEAQVSNREPVPVLESLGSEVANIREQAARGDAMAEYRLGRLYLAGTGFTADYKQAAKYLQLAAEQGLTEAEMVLGYLYENGKGVPRDGRRAFEYYAAAAKQGDLTAKNNLASMYEHGRGVRKDIRKSLDWYAFGEQFLTAVHCDRFQRKFLASITYD
jgi:Sel1 repeat